MIVSVRTISLFVVLALILAPVHSLAQESKSAALAAELCKLLDEKKLDSIAAKESDNQYVGALYFAGTQLLVVRGRFSTFARMTHLLQNKEFKEAYMDLSGASELQSRAFIMDLGANGFHSKRAANQPLDTADVRGKSFRFDGEWRKAKITEAEYLKTFTETDQEYAEMLQTLIDALKKPS